MIHIKKGHFIIKNIVLTDKRNMSLLFKSEDKLYGIGGIFSNNCEILPVNIGKYIPTKFDCSVSTMVVIDNSYNIITQDKNQALHCTKKIKALDVCFINPLRTCVIDCDLFPWVRGTDPNKSIFDTYYHKNFTKINNMAPIIGGDCGLGLSLFLDINGNVWSKGNIIESNKTQIKIGYNNIYYLGIDNCVYDKHGKIFDDVIRIDMYSSLLYCLTSSGDVYTKEINDWILIKSDIYDFISQSPHILYIDFNGKLWSKNLPVPNIRYPEFQQKTHFTNSMTKSARKF